jgi:hypothetical protein
MIDDYRRLALSLRTPLEVRLMIEGAAELLQ